MENQAIEPSVERSADLSGFDEKLSTILKDFFQEKQIPIDGQQLLAHELRRSFVYSAAGFDAYLSGDPAKGSLRGIFGSTSISTRKGMQVRYLASTLSCFLYNN